MASSMTAKISHPTYSQYFKHITLTVITPKLQCTSTTTVIKLLSSNRYWCL